MRIFNLLLTFFLSAAGASKSFASQVYIHYQTPSFDPRGCTEDLRKKQAELVIEIMKRYDLTYSNFYLPYLTCNPNSVSDMRSDFMLEGSNEAIAELFRSPKPKFKSGSEELTYSIDKITRLDVNYSLNPVFTQSSPDVLLDVLIRPQTMVSREFDFIPTICDFDISNLIKGLERSPKKEQALAYILSHSNQVQLDCKMELTTDNFEKINIPCDASFICGHGK